MASEICTSECRCYDGVTITTNENTKQVFDRSDVDDQGIMLFTLNKIKAFCLILAD